MNILSLCFCIAWNFSVFLARFSFSSVSSHISISLKPKRIKRPSSYRGGHQGLRTLEDEITDPVKSTYSCRGLGFHSQHLDAGLQSFTKFPHSLLSPVGIRQECGTHTCRSHTCTHTCSPTLMRLNRSKNEF